MILNFYSMNKQKSWNEATTEQCTLRIVNGSACSSHKPMNKKLGYAAWHDWADRKTRQGHKQKQCPECGKWFFRCEW